MLKQFLVQVSVLLHSAATWCTQCVFSSPLCAKRIRMLYKLAILLVITCVHAMPVWAQRDKEERREEQKEKKAATDKRVDYTVFRRQILTLPEFAEQRKKLSEIRKSTGNIPKIFAVVDSLNDTEDSKTLTGYITLILGDNTANVYEVTFDRVQRKIVKVKPTGETLEVEKPETIERRDKNTKTAKKKKGNDEDEDQDEPEADEDPEDKPEKPTKRKQKDEDDE